MRPDAVDLGDPEGTEGILSTSRRASSHARRRGRRGRSRCAAHGGCSRTAAERLSPRRERLALASARAQRESTQPSQTWRPCSPQRRTPRRSCLRSPGRRRCSRSQSPGSSRRPAVTASPSGRGRARPASRSPPRRHGARGRRSTASEAPARRRPRRPRPAAQAAEPTERRSALRDDEPVPKGVVDRVGARRRRRSTPRRDGGRHSRGRPGSGGPRRARAATSRRPRRRRRAPRRAGRPLERRPGDQHRAAARTIGFVRTGTPPGAAGRRTRVRVPDARAAGCRSRPRTRVRPVAAIEDLRAGGPDVVGARAPRRAARGTPGRRSRRC